MWIGAVQFELLFVSIAVIAGLLAVLLRILLILRATSPSTATDMIVTHGTFGLYLGWVCVAVTANVAAWVATLGVDTFPGWEWFAVAIYVVIVAIGLGLAGFTRGYLGPAVAISWGLSWVAVARSEGNFESSVLVISAVIAAAAVMLGTIVIRIVAEQCAKSTW